MATVKSLANALHRVVDFLEINDAHKQELRDAIGTEVDAVEDKPADTEEKPAE